MSVWIGRRPGDPARRPGATFFPAEPQSLQGPMYRHDAGAFAGLIPEFFQRRVGRVDQSLLETLERDPYIHALTTAAMRQWRNRPRFALLLEHLLDEGRADAESLRDLFSRLVTRLDSPNDP